MHDRCTHSVPLTRMTNDGQTTQLKQVSRRQLTKSTLRSEATGLWCSILAAWRTERTCSTRDDGGQCANPIKFFSPADVHRVARFVLETLSVPIKVT